MRNRKVNVEEGVRRIVWIIALLGLVAGLIGAGWGVRNFIRRREMQSEIESIRADPKARTIVKKIIEADGSHESLTNVERVYFDGQTRKIKDLEQNIKWYYRSDPLFAIPGGIGWFVGVWILFFLVRWILRGFISNNPDN